MNPLPYGLLLSLLIGLCPACGGETDFNPTTESTFDSGIIGLRLDAQSTPSANPRLTDEGSPIIDGAELPAYETADCAPSMAGPPLPPHLTEADPSYQDRLEALSIDTLPASYELSALGDLDRWLLGYSLDVSELTRLDRDQLLARGPMGRAVLLALGTDPAPSQLDFRELRRGLYHFYNCDRGHPARLQDFVAIYGDYRTWPTAFIESSRPKIHPRRIWQNDTTGVYVAETIRGGLVSETEIILSGYRDDGALEFISYLSDGRIASRGEFKTGSEPVSGPSPYTCLACHYDAAAQAYSIFPAP